MLSLLLFVRILRFSLIQKGNYDNKYFRNKFKLMLTNKQQLNISQ